MLTTNFQLLANTYLGNFGGVNAYLRVYAKHNGQNLVNNYTDVTIEERIYASADYIYSGSNNWYLNSNAGNTSSSGARSFYAGETTISSVTGPVYHNSVGEGSISGTAYYNMSSWGASVSTGFSASLPTIPREYKINSLSVVTLGDPTSYLTVNLNQPSSSLYYKIEVLVEGTLAIPVATVSSNSASYSIAFNESQVNSIYQSMPNKPNITLYVSVSTYSDSSLTTKIGSTQTGSTTGNVVVLPVCGTISYLVNDTPTTSLTGVNDIIIKGKSSVVISTTEATSNTYSTITSYKVQESNTTMTSRSATVPNFDYSTITVIVTDSRNLSNKVTLVIPSSKIITDYVSPSISTLSLDRIAGVSTDVDLIFSASVWNNSFGTNQNIVKQVRYKVADTWYDITSRLQGYITNNNVIVTKDDDFKLYSDGVSAGWTLGISYNILLEIYDGISTYTYNYVQRPVVILDGTVEYSSYKNTNGDYHVGINGMPDDNYNLSVKGSMNADHYYVNGSELGSSETLPIGSIIAYPGDVAPNGWLLMGLDYSRTAYPELFAVIGTKFGVGDGSTTFGTNTKGRVFVGLDTTQTEFNVLGKIGGHKLLQAHEHSIEPYGGKGGYGSAGHTGIIAQTGGTTYNSYYASSTGGGDSQNLQPYIVTNYIIKAFNVAATASTSTVVDNLITPSPTDSLSANMGVELLKLINKSVITVMQNANYSASIGVWGGYYLTISPTAREINHDKFEVVGGIGGGIKIIKKCKFVLSALVSFLWDSGSSGEYDAILRRNRGGTITEVARSYTNKPSNQTAQITIPDFIIEDAEVNDIYVLYVSSSTAITMKIYGSTTSLVTYMTAKEY